MGNVVCIVLLTLCTAVGAAHLCGRLWGLLLCPREGREILYLLPVHNGDQGIEYKLRWALWTLHWNTLFGRGKLLLVNFSADEETLQICHAFLDDHADTQLCTPDQLEELLHGCVCKTLEGVLY